jgi:alkylhydroperoxidase family enzyme
MARLCACGQVGAMPYIEQIGVAQATGFLKKQFDAALERAGRVWHIVHVMSQNPRTMDASMKFYGAIMFGSSPLSRWQREMLAVVTAKTNDCFY